MKGRYQGTCSGCGLMKGDRDRNAGWYNLTPRGRVSRNMLFCPPCSGALLVGLDERLAEGRKNPHLRAVLVGDLDRAILVMRDSVAFERYGVLEFFETLVRDGTPPAPPASHESETGSATVGG